MTSRYDENDPESYERPRRHTRPRTKDRPSYEDAVPAFVITGDRVRLVGDTSGADGSLARIVTVDPRTTVLRRTADDDDPVERVIVANADQLVIVTALADPEPRQGLVDRALVAAYDAGMDPLLCLTKADLADPEPMVANYRPLGVPYVVTQRGADLAEIVERLANRTSVLLGQRPHVGPARRWLDRRHARYRLLRARRCGPRPADPDLPTPACPNGRLPP